jgi:hypothetical protein
MIRTESLGFSGSIWEQEGIGSIIQRTDIHQGPFKAKFRGTFRERSRKVHGKFRKRESSGSVQEHTGGCRDKGAFTVRGI